MMRHHHPQVAFMLRMVKERDCPVLKTILNPMTVATRQDDGAAHPSPRRCGWFRLVLQLHAYRLAAYAIMS